MEIPELGELKDVNVREAWPHEAHNFTPWLAENLDAVSDVIGVPLELEGREVRVDQFSADIVARCPLDDSIVLIENQLEITDHTHLGQVLTYLAGLNAQTVIWIAKNFTPAHLSAVKWLNDHTVEPFAFFAVRVRVVQIDNSPIAPVFEVLEQPNEWDRRLSALTRGSGELGELSITRRDFWAHLKAMQPGFENVKDGYAAHHIPFPLLGGDVTGVIYFSLQSVGIFLRPARGDSAEGAFTRLCDVSDTVWTRLGVTLEDSARGHFAAQRLKIDGGDRTNWDRMAAWLHEQAAAYKEALPVIPPRRPEPAPYAQAR
ncbi:MAG: hypothetical protein ACYYKD_08020 [Rhodospirillales bacterium]